MHAADLTPELLSPAGNWDCARAAVAAGADAIFFGLPKFNARLRADNFTEADLPELMVFLHKHGVKGFVAMNTLIFTGELEAAERQLRLIADAGVDALIIQDLGLAKMAREIAPEVELHASTQMTISSPEGLRFVESLFPLERAVLARELSVKEIGRFGPASTTPLEVFVHGALCVAYSGQCLTSESLGQRSANRGECAQACRMPYELVVDGETRDMGERRYLLSPQDLAAVDLIPELVKAGVKSFKIEGRLKSPEYVAAVTRVYRKALDACLRPSAADPAQSPITPIDRYELEMTFSRGLTSGWLGGTDHPYLTHGRFGKKRGPLLGTIAACGGTWIELCDRTGIPLKAGDGVVFDAGENRDLEQGAKIWKIEGERIIFHRSFSGINFSRLKPGQTIYKTSDEKLESDIRRFWQNAKLRGLKQPLHLVASGKPGEPLKVACGRCSVTSEMPLGEAAKHPLTVETLRAQLGRLGDTPFELASLDFQLEGDCHLPLSEINRLRRELVEALPSQEAGGRSSRSASAISVHDLLPPIPGSHESGPPPVLSVLCRSLPQVEAALDRGVPTIYCDFEDPRRYKDAVVLRQSASGHRPSAILLATPRIMKPGESGYLKLIDRSGADGILLRNLAALEYYKDRNDLRKVADFSLNVANPISARLLKEAADLETLTVSYDLNVGQAIDLLEAAPPEWFELTLHQHMPMFHMEHCVFCTFLSSGTSYKDCGRPCESHVVHMRDRVGQLHRLTADVGCRNTLFNGRAQTGARFFDELRATGLAKFRIELLDEDDLGALRAIGAYQDLLAGRIDAATLLDNVKAFEKLGVTEGTLK
ncbi:MAG: U32 family peptidase [Verrucomicrobia bacterium]|nr:MAG: U32 family peptidase [Verrucomicrobiota bacterium]TAE86669.1 MAG: U32 family peptidase [Verrucomicrobiota bacterium]TAF24448.1 MAG: U32 family peptidase [Verrucomicrobiota bacterium]TAF40009.1 MAG: U32 family peptidase [Verrucomicrobiota bacterium]